MTKVRLTPNQRDRLLRLGRASFIPGTSGRWILDRHCGGPAALAHLYQKGFADRSLQFGPRGGDLNYYRPSQLGWEEIERLKAKTSGQRVTAGLPSAGEVDTALIHARDSGEVVRVITATGEYRGVPGQVHRAGDPYTSELVVPIGQREIPLAEVLRVESC